MNDFTVSGRIEADSRGAERALRNTGDAMNRTGRETRELGREAGRTAGTTDRLRTAEQQAARAADALAAANRRAGQAAAGAGRANGAAAGSMGNLVAQFNDIGVMMASGQNPLTLALQQGTQIAQVIGPMGAAGAVSALGGAFVGMLNPLSLITIGTIAGAAALSNWFTSADDAGDAAMTLEDHLQRVADATERYQEFAELAASSTSDLEERFGSASGAVRSTLQLLERLAASEAQSAIDGIAASMANMLSMSGDGDRRTGAAEFFDVNIGLAFTDVQREARAEARLLTAEFINQSDTLARSNGDLDAQIDALTTLISITGQLADANGNRSAQEDEMLKQMSEALLAMYEQRGAVEDAAASAKRAYQDYYDSRIRAEDYLASMRARELSDAAEIYGQYALLRTQSDAEVATAQDLLDKMTAQNDLQQAINDHGAASAQVTALRAQAERDALEETLATMDVAESLKDELRAAFEAGVDLKNVDMSDGIRQASAAARELVAEIMAASGAAQSLGQTAAQKLRESELKLTYANDPVSLAGALARDQMAATQAPLREGASAGEQAYLNQQLEDYVAMQEQIARNDQQRSELTRGNSSAATASQKERDAVQDLIKSLQQEVDVLRELDPVQQEMIRQRETLQGATAAERDQIEQLIATKAREAEAMEIAKANMQEWKDLTYSTFDDLIQSGGDLEGVFNNLSNALLNMAQQALLLGEGPLAELFGTTGGGLLGSLFSSMAGGKAGVKTAAIPAKAEGGMIYGPGSGTSDDVLMWGSSGEFMMNAKATQKNRQLLELLNAGGTIPGFAQGGMIGGQTAGASGFGGVNISIENRGSAPVTGDVQETSDGAGGRKFTLILADQVGSALTTRGGGARRALTSAYGVRQRGTKR